MFFTIKSFSFFFEDYLQGSLDSVPILPILDFIKATDTPNNTDNTMNNARNIEAVKIVVVAFGEAISEGEVKEVHFASNEGLINGGRQAYAAAGVNVIVQPATMNELVAYGNGGEVAVNDDARTVAQLANAVR